MDPVTWTFVILGAAIVAFLSGKVPLEVVAVGVSLALWATGVLTLPQALAGFGDPTVLFIASLFVVAAALDATGLTARAGRLVVARAGRSRVGVVLSIALLVAVLTAFISINGAVAALVPVVAVIARRAGIAAGQLMMPLAFLASAASLLTLTGTPVNVVVSELAAESGARPFGYLEFALVGGPLLVVTAAVVLLAGPRLLPRHAAARTTLGERATETLSLLPDAVLTGENRILARKRGFGVPRLRLGRGSRRTLVITGVMVVLLATGLVPAAVAGLLAAGALILTRVLGVTQVYRSISWTTVVLIAGMIPLSQAFLTTGAAEMVADAVVSLVGQAPPQLALLVLAIVVVVLGQFISNVATVLIVAPVATSIAATLGLSPLPFLMSLTVVGAASFLTPVATPANLMVMDPGGYRFGDYWRLGLPLTLVFVLFAVLYVPLVWRF
ncbi:SLC13 family permease [Microbacterium sp. SORGH_AS_0888]|uniref:SLC13 family permease n=1 Tax=Microbacterium sp. SORGH_AS_0888 TaxID=3041791 RepID=UPI0027879E2C|nr:SLC13 family permease [Microbacterium sp. SORGH_AS_0888]MDQ1129534.1 di/tricarboxylate transporter [Microbacterium sp. SORGH_AS_0888]